MPAGRKPIYNTAESQAEARREKQKRYRQKKKQNLNAVPQDLSPATGIFISHNAESLLGENSLAGIVSNTPQDIGILADNLDLLDIVATQSQPVAGSSQQSPSVGNTPLTSPTYEPPDILLAPHPNNISPTPSLDNDMNLRDDDIFQSSSTRHHISPAPSSTRQSTPTSDRLPSVESLICNITNLQVTSSSQSTPDPLAQVIQHDNDNHNIDNNAVDNNATDDDATVELSEEAQREADNKEVVEWLSQQLVNFHMCSDDSHKSKLVGHSHESELHGDLDHTFGSFDVDSDSPIIPYVLDSPTLLKTSNNTPELKHIWQAMEGQRANEGFSQVCLHWYDKMFCGKPPISFDFDSILAFPSSLAIARSGISYIPISATVSNLTTDLHLTMRVRYYDEDGRMHDKGMSMHKVPHYCLGRLVGWPEISLYVIFPSFFLEDRQSTYLTQDQMQQWTDKILLPAIYRYLPASLKQHLPSSYSHSYHTSLAKGKEQRATKPTTQQSRVQLFSYELQPQYLLDIWSHILELVETPGLQHFRGIQLFLNGKNLKMSTQGSTIKAASDTWNARWETCIDEQYLNPDSTFIDIGKETCAPYSYLPDEVFDKTRQPQVLVWRKCCLETCYRESLLGDPARLSLRRFYQQSMLRDSASMTVLTAKKSKARRSNLIYSQYYPSLKEFTDAAQSHPFDNSAIESLGVDRHIFKAFQSTARSQNHHIGAIEQAYLNSKARVHAGLEGSMQKSFGTREEHRMSLTLLRQLIDSWKATGVYDKSVELQQQAPFYIIPTFHMMHFLRFNINKFAWAFEHTLATCQPDYISWEKTKLMVLFLRYLRLSIGCQNLPAESAVWLDRKTVEWQVDDRKENIVKEGMGASKTIVADGYCWMLPKIDWVNWVFDEAHSKNMAVGNPKMLKAYRKRAEEVGDLQELWIRLNAVDGWLATIHDAPSTLHFRVGEYLMHLCLQEFTRYVWRYIQKDIKPRRRVSCLAGKVSLSWANVNRCLEQSLSPPHIVSGNRMWIKHPLEMVSYLWGFNDKHIRQYWEDASFRTLYRKSTIILRQHLGRDFVHDWQARFRPTFLACNFILPYPHPRGFWDLTKQGDRMWTAYTHECRWIGWDKSHYTSRDFLALGHRKKDGANWELVRYQSSIPSIQPFSLAIINLLNDDLKWSELKERLTQG
jgi:hypothetical protein